MPSGTTLATMTSSMSPRPWPAISISVESQTAYSSAVRRGSLAQRQDPARRSPSKTANLTFVLLALIASSIGPQCLSGEEDVPRGDLPAAPGPGQHKRAGLIQRREHAAVGGTVMPRDAHL